MGFFFLLLLFGKYGNIPEIKHRGTFTMGGNLTLFKDTENEIQSEKVDLKLVGRQKLIKFSNSLFKELNKKFFSLHKEYLWDDKIEFKELFNGSSSFVLSNDYNDEEILKYKPTMGDIDIAIPEQFGTKLNMLLKTLEGKQVAPGVIYLGNNRDVLGKEGTQINSIFRFTDPVDYLVQVDFELLPFENNQPTEWSKFSHSSSFEDTKANIKAVFHKYLIRALVGSVSVRPDIVIATPASTPDNIKLSKAKNDTVARMLKFSVDKGCREALTPVLDTNGKIIEIDGKGVYKNIPTNQSDYKTSLIEIYKMIFGEESEPDVKKMWTFTGVLELCKQLTKDQKDLLALRFYELLWGLSPERAQELERDNPQLDVAIKGAAWDTFNKVFKTNIPNHEQRLEAYYKDY